MGGRPATDDEASHQGQKKASHSRKKFEWNSDVRFVSDFTSVFTYLFIYFIYLLLVFIYRQSVTFQLTKTTTKTKIKAIR